MKVIVLGGAGAMAQVTVRDLVESPGVDLVGIADINYQAATRFVEQLGSDKVTAAKADVRDAPSLEQLIRGFDVVVNSTWYEFNLLVMKAAIAAGVHYLDLGGLYHMTLKQLELDMSARDANITCILGIGSTPGTMNLLAAHGATKMTQIEKVSLRSGSVVVGRSAEGFQAPYSIRTVLDEFTLPAIVLRDGRIQDVPPLSGRERFVLPEPVNEVEGYYTLHSELATLPRTLDKGVREMDFIVAYPPAFTQTMALLVKMGLASRQPMRVQKADVAPYDLVATVIDSLPKSDAELDVDVQRVELKGEADGKPLMLRYEAISVPHERWKIGGGTVGTGVPPSIAAQWLGTNRIKVRGAVPPESCIDPPGFFKELGVRDRGIRIVEHAQESRLLS